MPFGTGDFQHKHITAIMEARNIKLSCNIDMTKYAHLVIMAPPSDAPKKNRIALKIQKYGAQAVASPAITCIIIAINSGFLRPNLCGIQYANCHVLSSKLSYTKTLLVGHCTEHDWSQDCAQPVDYSRNLHQVGSVTYKIPFRNDCIRK